MIQLAGFSSLANRSDELNGLVSSMLQPIPTNALNIN